MLLQTYATQFLCSLIEYYLIVKGRLNPQYIFIKKNKPRLKWLKRGRIFYCLI